MFPKLASGTSGKLRENMGNDMTEALRKRFFGSTCISQDYREALEWGQRRIASLESHLNDRNQTIDRLEAEIQGLNNQLLGKSTSSESEEELHQRRRHERMLDEVTLICVRDGIERMNRESTAEKTWGRMSRDTAENICCGINEFDA